MKIYVVGSINMDLVIKAPFMPENGMTINGEGFMQNPGGKGANQAVAVAKLGGNSIMVGAVGNSFGKELISTLNGYGVNTKCVKEYTDCSSGIAVIVVVDNDNRIILDAGANAFSDTSLIDKAFEDAEAGDYVICQLEVKQEIVKYTFEQAKKKGIITICNPAPAAKLIDGILCNTDYFIPNQSECEFYTGIYPDTTEKAKEAAAKLNELGVKNVVITLGTHGSCAIVNNDYIEVPAHKVEAVDTTAAGDTYIGALVTKLSEGSSIKEAMEFASKASSITVTRSGAQKSIPYRSEIN